MQVILLEDNKNLGKLGSIVNVKSGYARNYLIVKNKAKFATKENIALFEEQKDKLIQKANKLLADAKDKAQEMTDTVLTIKQNASDDGKLFGSISPYDIVKELAKLKYDIQKKDINMPDGIIGNTGEYNVVISLHPNVSIDIKIIVEAK